LCHGFSEVSIAWYNIVQHPKKKRQGSNGQRPLPADWLRDFHAPNGAREDKSKLIKASQSKRSISAEKKSKRLQNSSCAVVVIAV
jgi:hypothetical protein